MMVELLPRLLHARRSMCDVLKGSNEINTGRFKNPLHCQRCGKYSKLTYILWTSYMEAHEMRVNQTLGHAHACLVTAAETLHGLRSVATD